MPDTAPQLAPLFFEISRRKLLDEFWPRLRGCAASLSDRQIWWRPNPASNSAGNLLLHLNGNVRQWLVTSFNRADDSRDRPAEFARREGIPGAELLEILGETMQQASAVLARLTPSDLLAQYEIQGFRVSGLEAVYHVVEHFAMHYGQILYIAKTLQGADLGFYRELDKSGRAG